MQTHPQLTKACSLLTWSCYGIWLFSAVWWLAAPPVLDAPASWLLDTLTWSAGAHTPLNIFL